MQTFRCLACGQPLYFDDSACSRCGATLGFLPDQMRLASMESCVDGTWRATPRAPWSYRPGFLERLFGAHPKLVDDEDSGRRYRRCANETEHQVCNWMVDAESGELWCPACRTNRTIPSLARPGNLEVWRRLERAKRRVFFGLMRLGLSITDRRADPDHGLAFDFLSGQDAAPDQAVLTGHCNGLVTVAIDGLEAYAPGGHDAIGRDLVGMFRQLLGYYFWDRLVRDRGALDEFRALFGDERLDYAATQQRHHLYGAPADWPDRFVSSSASAHPWDDWAETWGLYLRMVDILETAGQFDALGNLRLTDEKRSGLDPKHLDFTAEYQTLLDRWPPTAFALSNLNRNLGQSDLYPDRLLPAVAEKLSFVHRAIRLVLMG